MGLLDQYIKHMKFITKKTMLAFILGFVVIPGLVLAQITIPQGGTGRTAFSEGSVPFSDSSSLRLATSSNFQFSDSLSQLSVTNGVFTTATATTLCLNGTCETGWPATSLTNDSVVPDHLLSTGQTDEYCISYEATGDTWEWQSCSGGGGGDNVSVDGGAVTDPDFVSTGDIDFVNTSNTITANINAGSIIETDLDGDVAPVDGDFLQYDSTGTNFTWRSAAETKTDLSLNNVENTTLSTWTGSTALTTVGTIATGVWQATALTDTYVSDTLTIGLSSTIADGLIVEPDLSADVAAVDGDFLQYDSTGTNFTWRSASEVLSDIGAEADLVNEAGLYAALSDVTGFFETSDTIDISSNTNLAAGTGATLTGDTISVDLGTSISSSEIDADTITHADIADADQTITVCFGRIEDPTADDDFQSIWANKTANDFLITEIWGESDQTVNFDLQIDDGTPADVNGTDISPAAGEAEDTTLSGDTTLAAGEELDLAITSVSGTPTWVSICWTGNWVD